MQRIIIAAAACVLALAGCAIPTNAALADFTDDKAVVAVRFTMFGPSQERSAEAALPEAVAHCRTVGKRAVPVSVRTRTLADYTGEYLFLYRCEGVDRVRVIE